MAAKKNKAYMDQSFIVSLILAIIPITNLVLGILHRVQKGKLLLALLNFVLFFIFYWVDLVSVVLNNNLKYLV